MAQNFQLATIASPLRVNSDTGVITGVSLASLGLAGSNGVFFDENSLDSLLIALGGDRLQAYIVHKDPKLDRLTEEIGYYDNFRLHEEKNRVIADFYALKSFQDDDGPAFRRLFEMAEKMPERFGVSLTLQGSLSWAVPEGYVDSKERPPAALFPAPTLFVSKVRSADFVDQPDINPNGLFSQVDSPGILEMANLKELNDKLQAENASLQEQLKKTIQLSQHEAAQSALEEKVKTAEEKTKEVEVQLSEKTSALTEANQKVETLEKAVKAEKDLSEEITAQLSEKTKRVEDLEKLMEGENVIQLGSFGDAGSDVKKARDKAIADYAKENGVDEFTATIQLGKQHPKLFNQPSK